MKKYMVILALLFLSFTNEKVEGLASYYHSKFEGRKTSSGEKYRKSKMTAACNIFPIHSLVKVRNLRTGKEIIVKINDHIGTNKRIIDLSLAAAKELNIIHRGLTKVSVSLQ